MSPVGVPYLAASRFAEVRWPLVGGKHLGTLAKQLRAAGHASFRAGVEFLDIGFGRQRQVDLASRFGNRVELGALIGDEGLQAATPDPQRLVGFAKITRRMGEIEVSLLPWLGNLRPKPISFNSTVAISATGNFCSTSNSI